VCSSDLTKDDAQQRLTLFEHHSRTKFKLTADMI
jgi:hypothetical protein